MADDRQSKAKELTDVSWPVTRAAGSYFLSKNSAAYVVSAALFG